MSSSHNQENNNENTTQINKLKETYLTSRENYKNTINSEVSISDKDDFESIENTDLESLNEF